ncbi:MAG: hypothetical protein SOV54_08265 [Faecalibacterium prausnitzii]|nr:hypothetical protein [Faecalibacterium prausnitzii]
MINEVACFIIVQHRRIVKSKILIESIKKKECRREKSGCFSLFVQGAEEWETFLAERAGKSPCGRKAEYATIEVRGAPLMVLTWV